MPTSRCAGFTEVARARRRTWAPGWSIWRRWIQICAAGWSEPGARQRPDLAPGDALVLYTDGVTDALNGEGEMFGDDRLREVITARLGWQRGRDDRRDLRRAGRVHRRRGAGGRCDGGEERVGWLALSSWP